MTRLRAPLTVLLFWASLVLTQAAPQEKPPLPRVEISAATEAVHYVTNGLEVWSNAVVVNYLALDPSSNVVLTADSVSVNTNTGDMYAEGSVRLLRQDQTWTGPRIHYNFKTQLFDADEFRAGKWPLFVTGRGLHADATNGTYTATNAVITTDDYEHPLQQVRAGEVTIAPGQYVEARNATLNVGDVPVFYWPYYRRDLSEAPNRFNFTPGYRTLYGPYLLSSYQLHLTTNVDGTIHADWRQKRGFGVGPDLDLRMGRFGEAAMKYYYTHDDQPGTDPNSGAPLPHDRQRAYLSYLAEPWTNLTLRSQVAYQSDSVVVRDFFESQYRQDVQPNTFFEANKLWQNWSLDALAQPRVNPFFETVARLPELRLTGLRQQLGPTPLFYESETTAGYYRRLFADTNLTASNFYAARADTFQQITLPETLFGWLNVVPRAGGRYTYYSDAQGAGATTTNEDRWVFNTGVELSFKASKVWSTARNHFWEVDGLRHIVEPSVNYAYVPRPNVLPGQLPQFDYEFTNSLQLPPLDFPDYNSIDSIDSQNTIRLRLGNRLQTKRAGEIDNLLNWDVYTDWRLRPRTNQTTFSDVFSALELKPWSWLRLGSELRYDVDQERFNLAQHRLTFTPNNAWSWTVGQYYLRSGPLFGAGSDLLTSTMFYRLNENWGMRFQHNYDAKSGTMQEQAYTLYRDLRSWTVALTFRALDSTTTGHDYGVAFTFSLKSFPRFKLGQDTVNTTSLLGN
jgi:LPS-assembly protein